MAVAGCRAAGRLSAAGAKISLIFGDQLIAQPVANSNRPDG